MLGRSPSDWLSLSVTGYQFPDADNPQKRFSWHMVAGEARCSLGEWSFRYAALTCDESPLVSAWLRKAAAAHNVPASRQLAPLTFTEPNLSFRLGRFADDVMVIDVDLDMEFQPSWRRLPGMYAGDPFTLSLTTDAAQLRQAAEDWDRERGPFPDGLGAAEQANPS